MLFEFYGVKRCRERGEQNGADDRLHDVEGRFGYSRGNVVEQGVGDKISADSDRRRGDERRYDWQA